jgi:iron complex transport system substrate-binding protein
MKQLFFIVLTFLVCSLISSCDNFDNSQINKRSITDAAGRKVNIPDTINSVVALRSGALRLLCYMDVAKKVDYIEGNEKRRNVPYLMANPNLKNKPVIGAGNNFDTELLATSNADLIIVTFMNTTDADKLQETIRKPVVLINYGDLKNNKENLFESLKVLGEIFHKQSRADSLIEYISQNLSEFKYRSTVKKKVTAYIGGVAYRGAHGISSTEPGYPPFTFLSIENVASSLEEVVSSPLADQENAFIDIEQLLIWNPDYLFLDAAGKSLWKKEVNDDILNENLVAFKYGKVYSVLPYNWYTTNYENILCNSWFIGKVVYPESFSDIDLESKCRDIYSFFLGDDVYDEMKKLYEPYSLVSE